MPEECSLRRERREHTDQQSAHPNVGEEREEVVVDGKRLETLRLSPLSADASAPTIVMLHEGLGSISMWKVPQLEHRRIPRANRAAA